MEKTEEKTSEYVIYNLGCAAAMVSLGYELFRVDWDKDREEKGARANFIFSYIEEEFKEEIKTQMLKYQQMELEVDAKKYYFALAEVRNAMYGAKKETLHRSVAM